MLIVFKYYLFIIIIIIIFTRRMTRGLLKNFNRKIITNAVQRGFDDTTKSKVTVSL